MKIKKITWYSNTFIYCIEILFEKEKGKKKIGLMRTSTYLNYKTTEFESQNIIIGYHIVAYSENELPS